MDFNIDFGDTSGFRAKAGKKKKAAAATKFDPWGADGNDKKDDAGTNGSGGGDGAGYGGNGGGGDSGGAGGGGDDNNNGNDDDDWGFSAVKKNKKKTKKQQQEEEEEERRRQEEEDAKANNAGNNNPLSWADDVNDTQGNEEWGMWGTKKDKKKKKDDGLPAVPDAPPAASTFQDINLDDGAPKLDFTFDGLNETKKNDNAGGFGAWGKTWDFGSIAKEEKKEETSEFGNNNPWGLGGKNKKKTTMSTGFDFGDFGSADANDLTFDTNNNDVADGKPADDAWGFATQGKKDKKKKGAIEEIKEEPIESESKNDEGWGGWGTAKPSKTKKKSTLDDTFADAPADNPDKNGDMSFDWGFGGSKTKKKDLVAEVVDEPTEKAADGDDWMSGAWGAASKKKKDKKKGTTEDLSASIDLTSNADSKTVTSDPPADDIWSTFTSTKDKKKSKKGFFDDEPPPPPEAPEPPPANNDSIWGSFGTKSTKKSKGFDLISEAEEISQPQEVKEPLVAWDYGLAPKDKRKKEKQMKADGTWEDRVTQEMVDAEAEKAVEPAIEVVADELAEPEPEPISALEAPDVNLSLANEVPWDFGLSPVKKRKREKEMRLDGTWDTRITQEMIDEAKAAVAAAASAAAAVPAEEPLQELDIEAPAKSLADEVPWDHGLDALTRRKKQKEMKADGTWDTRITQTMIDEAKAAEEEAKRLKPFEDELEFEPVQDPEPEVIPEPAEVRYPWDHGLNPKEKRKREKEMRADGIWEDRLTQEKIDEEAAAAVAAAAGAKDLIEPEYEPEPEPEPGLKETFVEERFPWDHGLSVKEKRRVEKQMKLDGTWESRLTQESIDEEARAADNKVEKEPDLVFEPEEPAHVDPADKKPWDHGLNTKEKKKLEKQMKLDGIWEDRLTQEQIDEEIAAAAAAAVVNTEPEPDITAVVEQRVPWDHGLGPKEKRKKEKEMKLIGTWEDRLTQEKIDEEDAAASAQIISKVDEDTPMDVGEASEPRLPWDHGLNVKEKKRREKEMRLNGTWADRLTQEQIDEEEAAKAAVTAVVEEPEPEPEPEEQANDSWSFGWGASKTKAKKKSLLDPEPEKPEEKTEEGWGGGWGFGLKKKKDKTPVEETPPPPPPEPEPEPKVDDVWSFGASTKDKKKKEKTARKSDLFEPVVEDIEPAPPPPAEEDIWATFGAKSDKKTGKKSKTKEEAPPPPPSPPPTDVLPEEEADTAIPSVDDFDWGGLGTGRKSNKSLTQETSTKKSSKSLVEEPPAKKSNKSLVDETPARKSNKSLVEETSAKKSSKSLIDEEPAKKSSVWGFGSTNTTAKTKKEKEAQAKKEAEEQAQREEEERLQREAEEAEVERLAAEEAAKVSKKSKAGKSSKISKEDGKKKSDDLLDLLDEPVPTPATSSSKLKKSSTRGSDKQIADLAEEEPIPEVEPEKDYFGFWGGSSNNNAKKTTGKKSIGSKKEITTSVLTNEEDALLAELDENEIQAILDDAPVRSSSKVTRTMSNEKTKQSSSVADRIKAFGGGKEDGGKKSKQAEARLTNVEPEIEETLSPKEEKKATKGKSSKPTSAKSSKLKVEEEFALPNIEPKKSKDSVPGSFPGAFADEEEDLLGIEEALPEPDLDFNPEPVSTKSKKKSDKTEKKVSKTSGKSSKKSMEAAIMDDPVDNVSRKRSVVDEPDLLDEEVTLPTPPPEAEKKSAKKERPRVERSATSWGFWGTAPQPPKKLSRSKTLDDVSPPSSRKTKSPPAMTRSKSIRTAKADDNDTQKESKSSASDKESATRSVERSKPTRGMSGLTNFMLGGAPPSAMRQSQNIMGRRQSSSSHPISRSSSRRQSMDQSGIMSPPPEDESPVTRKATKMLGYAADTQKRSSVKGKSNSYADPYPIDDDDMVMIRDNSKGESKSRSKPSNKIVTNVGRPSTKPRSKTLSGDEDVVMVDSPLAIDSANEDFVRPPLQRSNTARKSAGLFGSLFGMTAKAPIERSRSSPVTDNEDNGLPIRSRTSSRKRTGEALVTDMPGETDGENARQSERHMRRSAREQAEDDERQAREQRRRDRREREKADLEARREKAREQARREREAEEQQKQERRARRREREAAERARIEREEAEAEAAAERRREERRRRERAEVESPIYPISKEDRRRTYAGEDERRRSRREEQSKSRAIDSPGRRSSALMAEYHESRSGSGRGVKPPANKTSSWIDSQKEEPPDLPPVEGTVLDPSGQTPRPVEDAESESRRRKKDKYAGMTEEEIARYRAKRRERRLVEKSTSSDEKAKKSAKRRTTYEDDYYANPARTFDARPALGRSESKRNSLFGRFF